MMRLLKTTETYCISNPKIRFCKLRKRFIIYPIARYKSHYSSLGLDSSASPKDIKAAYYKLSFKYHPDKNTGSPESVNKFREITEAYEVLSNPERKREYDYNRHFEPEFRRDNWKYSSARYEGRAQYTGKTKDFDYDEHFRRHYEQYYEEKQREEHEYFKRRWEAEYARRYGSSDDFFKQRQRSQYYKSTMSGQRMHISKSSLFFFSVWGLIFILHLMSTAFDQDIPRKKAVPLYYDVEKKNDTD